MISILIAAAIQQSPPVFVGQTCFRDVCTPVIAPGPPAATPLIRFILASCGTIRLITTTVNETEVEAPGVPPFMTVTIDANRRHFQVRALSNQRGRRGRVLIAEADEP